jgi:hypothetical protein
MKNYIYPVTLKTIYRDLGLIPSETAEAVSDKVLHEPLQHEGEQAFSTGEGSEATSRYRGLATAV